MAHVYFLKQKILIPDQVQIFYPTHPCRIHQISKDKLGFYDKGVRGLLQPIPNLHGRVSEKNSCIHHHCDYTLGLQNIPGINLTTDNLLRLLNHKPNSGH